jgi:hypothetical protein
LREYFIYCTLCQKLGGVEINDRRQLKGAWLDLGPLPSKKEMFERGSQFVWLLFESRFDDNELRQWHCGYIQILKYGYPLIRPAGVRTTTARSVSELQSR